MVLAITEPIWPSSQVAPSVTQLPNASSTLSAPNPATIGGGRAGHMR